MKYCTSCGNQNEDFAKFCLKCGNLFSEFKNEDTSTNLEGQVILEGSLLMQDGRIKEGKIDQFGKWIVKPEFDFLGKFDDQNYCIAIINKKQGFIDKNSNWIIQPIFDAVWNYDSNNLSVIIVSGKYGLIDRKGNWVTQPSYETISLLKHGVYQVTKNKKLGVIDSSGNLLIKLNYDYILSGSNKNSYNVTINDKWGRINEFEQFIIQPIFDYLGDIDDFGYCLAEINNRKGFIDQNGNWVIQPIYSKLDKFDQEGYCAASINSNEYGFIDRKGNWIIQPIFEDSYGFWREFDKQGYRIASKNGKYGFIDRLGQWAIQPIFDGLQDFDDQGYCLGEIDEKYGYIDRQGRWIIDPKYDEIYNNNERCIARILDDDSSEEYHYLLDRKGNVIIDKTYLIDETVEGYYKVSKGYKYGYTDKNGKWVIQPIFDFAPEDSEGDPLIWNHKSQVWELDQSWREDEEDYEDEDEGFENVTTKPDETSEPKRKGFFNFKNLFILLMVILFITNPSEEYHKEILKQKLSQTLRNSNQNLGDGLFDGLAIDMGLSMMDEIVENSTTMKNFYLFSLTNFEYEGEEEIVGIGLLTNVFIFDSAMEVGNYE
jgi:hypothetical protein